MSGATIKVSQTTLKSGEGREDGGIDDIDVDDSQAAC